MQALILTIWISQGVLMFFDEFIFHRRRELGKWERLGHPIDSLFFLLPFIYTQFFKNEYVFIILSIFSCILITKDEIVHSEECLPLEQWLHSVLFIIHPIALYFLWEAWKNELHSLIQVQSVIIFIFMLYQYFYWNIYKGTRHEA